jgi:hypothetical protein
MMMYIHRRYCCCCLVRRTAPQFSCGIQRRQGRYADRSQVNTLSEILGNQRQLGATLLGLGLLLTVMGMMLFFEGNLLRLGNVRLMHCVPRPPRV